MKKQPDDLEYLLCYLKCARDSLLVIRDSMEGASVDSRVLMSAVYSSYIQLNWIAEAMQEQLDKIPDDIIRKACEGVSK